MLLNELKDLTPEKLDSRIEALRLDSKVLGLEKKSWKYALHSQLLQCSFRFCNEAQKLSLDGNPGVSKSWFQLYMLYRFVNRPPTPVVLIVRQEGENKVTFFDLQQSRAFVTNNMRCLHILDYLKTEEVVYMMEPDSSIREPYTSDIKMLISASPDKRCFKEFVKRGASMLYMPVWKLEELQTIGADVYARTAPEERNVLLTQEEIKERYEHFGGIIRYVISTDNERIGVLKSSQDFALSRTQPFSGHLHIW